MKTKTWICLLACGLGALSLTAQERERPRERPDRRQEGFQEERGRDRPGEAHGPHRGERPADGTPPPVMRYLQQLKERDPAEFERMNALRETDPMAFRRELRQQLIERRRAHHESRDPRRGPFRDELQQIREASTPEEREQAVTGLRNAVEAQVEENLKRREERMRQVRQQLAELEERHQEERERKDELVDRHVEKLLEKLEPQTTPDKGERHGPDDSDPNPRPER